MTWSRQARAKARTEPLSGVVSGQDTETVERFPTERDVTALMEATKALTAKQARCALEAASAYVWARAVPASVLAAARTELDEAKAERELAKVFTRMPNQATP